jgi:pimeloyl-ACP methyl ester carboxylesterase
VPRSGNIYYSEYPAGQTNLPALVLIHGAGSSSEVWPRQLRRLPGFRVFAVDLPAHGKSGGLPENSIVGYAAQLLEWMQANDIDRAVLVGHSMGAAIALTMALEAPETISKLVLLGAAQQFIVNPVLLEKLGSPALTEQAVNMIVTWSFARSSNLQLRQTYAEQLSSNQPGVLHQDFLACSAFDFTSHAKEIRPPSLLLSGQDDVMVPLQRSQELGTQLLRGTLKMINGAGHMLMQEKPTDAASIIGQFLGKRV